MIVAAVKPDANAATVKKDRGVAFESYRAEIKAINDGVQKAARYQQAGMTKEADREIAALARAYPNNPSVILLQEKDTFASRVEASTSFSKLQSDRILAAGNDLMVSSLPAKGDVEFPKDWKEKTKNRLKTVQLSAKEMKIIEALDKPITVDWNNKMLEEALQNCRRRWIRICSSTRSR